MSKKQNETMTISTDLVDAILKYIQSRPLGEVWNLFVAITNEIGANKAQQISKSQPVTQETSSE